MCVWIALYMCMCACVTPARVSESEKGRVLVHGGSRGGWKGVGQRSSQIITVSSNGRVRESLSVWRDGCLHLSYLFVALVQAPL